MSNGENKGAVRRFVERLNGADLIAVDEFVSDDVCNYAAPPGLAPGREGYRQFMGAFLAAFPDLRIPLHDLVAEGDTVAGRSSISGPHRGDFMGVPPSGKRFEVPSMTLMRFRQRKLAEEWVQMDMLGLLQQLGTVPASEQASA